MISKEIYDSWPVGEKRQAIDAAGTKCRITKEPSGTMFRFAPGMSRRGYRYSADYVCKDYTLVQSKVDKATKWKRSVEKVAKKLEASGLWPELQIKYSNLSKVDYEDWKKIRELYNSTTGNIGEDRDEQVKIYGEKLVDKYPFIFKGGIDTFYIWQLSNPKTKSMYFGKYSNSYEKEAIKKAMSEKRKFSTTARTSYDVTFQYDPEKNKAWYSEEYKDCGNGHYYLAIDENTALFCEDD